MRLQFFPRIKRRIQATVIGGKLKAVMEDLTYAQIDTRGLPSIHLWHHLALLGVPERELRELADVSLSGQRGHVERYSG